MTTEHLLSSALERSKMEVLRGRVVSQISKCDYACTTDEILAITTKCTYKTRSFSYSRTCFFVDKFRGGFLFLYWILFLSDRWIFNAVNSYIRVLIFKA